MVCSNIKSSSLKIVDTETFKLKRMDSKFMLVVVISVLLASVYAAPFNKNKTDQKAKTKETTTTTATTITTTKITTTKKLGTIVCKT